MRHFEQPSLEREPFDLAITRSHIQMIGHLGSGHSDPFRGFRHALKVQTGFNTMNGGFLALVRRWSKVYISGYSDDVIRRFKFVDQSFFMVERFLPIGVECNNLNLDFKTGVCVGRRSNELGPRLIASIHRKSPLNGSRTDVNRLSPHQMLVNTKSSDRSNAQLHQLHQSTSYISEAKYPRKRGRLGVFCSIAPTFPIPYSVINIQYLLYIISLSLIKKVDEVGEVGSKTLGFPGVSGFTNWCYLGAIGEVVLCCNVTKKDQRFLSELGLWFING